MTAHTPQLAEVDPQLHQVAVDVAVELAHDRGRGDGYRNGYRDGLAAGRAFRSRVELDATRRLHDALTGDYRSGARARDDRLLDSLRSTGILPAMAA